MNSIINPCIDWKKAVPQFIKDKDLIFSNEFNYFITFPDLNLGGFERGYLFFGACIEGWSKVYLTRSCPVCSKTAYIIKASGSPLSGSGSWAGLCPTCGYVNKSESVTGILLHPELRKKRDTLGYQLETLKVPLWSDFINENYPDFMKSLET